MSDYSSTFTENTGDTIDTSDFSTEFDAIETAVATKAEASVWTDAGEAHDTNGNEVIILGTTASAVNEVTITNAATGNGPTISASGETNTDLNISSAGTGDVNITSPSGSVVITGHKGIVILDTPEAISSPTATRNTWHTVNNSTLGTAGATAAIVRIRGITTITNTAVSISIYARKTGSGLGATSNTLIAYEREWQNSSGTIAATANGEFTVPLNSGSDFDYYISSSADPSPLEITIVGYYV